MKNTIDMPAIRGIIGDWAYYMTTFSYADLCRLTDKVENVLYKDFENGDDIYTIKNIDETEEVKQELNNNNQNINSKLQRERDLSHVEDISFYIKNENQRFFNSLVLAVYDDYPKWSELTFEFKGVEYIDDVGMISFPANSKLIPVDGQHRVEAIRAVYEENPDIDERIATIIVAHVNDKEGIERSRRLFTTLNKTAKPVSPKDLIILDEDNIACISTRKFYTEMTFNILNKSLIALQGTESLKNNKYFSSIITINNVHERLLDYYLEMNSDLFNDFKQQRHINKITMGEYKKRFRRNRPNVDVINSYHIFVTKYWETLIESIPLLKKLEVESNVNSDFSLRSSGSENAIFRPLFLKTLSFCMTKVAKDEDADLLSVIRRIKDINLSLNCFPWLGLIWDDNDKSMITRGNLTAIKSTTQYLLSESDEVNIKLLENYFSKNSYLYGEKDFDDVRSELETKFKNAHPNAQHEKNRK